MGLAICEVFTAEVLKITGASTVYVAIFKQVQSNLNLVDWQ